MPNVKLNSRHKHAGQWREPDETLSMSQPVADWLIGLGVAEPAATTRSKKTTAIADVTAAETETAQAADATAANHTGE
ncbi:hypothetical protein VSX61_08820 [Brenneria populi subsp. brevivirga]|uniref:DUF7210 family protein n=1 Tax=Brenneria populi TaxID=1505588 RepID=UPI002E1877D0|nr:hypothetical protein [Brenneria populi subsp. brevivirga]